VVNGYLTANLGSITAFSGIDWNQQQWLTMNIGGTVSTGTITYDGEMSPRLLLTATPYAFQAGQLAVNNGTSTGTLSIASPISGNQNFIIQDQGAAGTYSLLTQTAGDGRYIQNQNSSAQSTANWWISGTGRTDTSLLTPLLDTATATTLNIGTSTASAVSISKTGVATTINGSLTVSQDATFNGNLTVAAGKSLTITGGITSSRPASPTEGMLYYDTTEKRLLVYSNGQWQADRTTASAIVSTTASGGTSGAVASNYPEAADYVNSSTTSAQTAINAALSSLSSSGGTVYLMEGTYVIDGSINIPNNVTLAGTGNGTIIKLKNGVNADINMITNSDTSTGTGVVVTRLAIDGNKSNQTTGSQYGIYMNNMGATTPRTGATLTLLQINNVRTVGVYFLSGFLSSVTNNQITNAGSYGIFLTSSQQDTIQNNILQNDKVGVYLGSTVNNVNVTENVVAGNSQYGVDLDSTSSNNIISLNTFKNNGGAATNNAIFLLSSTSNLLSGNNISDSSATTNNYAINISDSGSGTNSLANNILGSGASINDAATSTVYNGQQNGNGYFVFNSSSARLGLGTSSPAYMLDVAGDINTSTGYRVGGTAGSTTTCSSGNVLQNAVVQGGIITGGTCVANGGGVSPTLQNAYDNSTSPATIVLTSTNKGITIKDASTTVGGNLFAVQNNGATTTYLGVTTTGVSVGGTLTVSGTINTNTFSSTALTFAGANPIIGASTTNTGLTLQANGTGTLTLNTTGAGTINLGTTNTTTLSIGNTTAATQTLIQGGTGANAVSIQTGASGTISIGTSAVAHTIAIGNGAAIQGITIGSTNSSSATTIQAGSGGITLTGAVSGSSTINAVTGFKFNGTSGSTLSCSAGNAVTNTTVQGGIITGGSCSPLSGSVTLQNAYDNSSTPATIALSSGKGLVVKDAASTVGNILSLQNSGGTTTYFNVTANGLQAAALDTVTAGTLSLGTSTANAISIGSGSVVTTFNGNVAIASGKTLSIQGATTISTTNTSALLVQNGSSSALLTADTSTMTLTIGTATNGIVFTPGSGWSVNGTAQNTKTIRLAAEYGGAVLFAGSGLGNNTGTMTSNFDSGSRMNYYDWTTTGVAAQSYDIIVEIPIPSDWSSWSSTTPLTISTYTTNTTNGTILGEIDNSSGTPEANCKFSAPTSFTPGSSSTWTTSGSTCTLANTTTGYTAGDYLTLRLRVQATSGVHVRVGNVTLSYKAKF
jgi:parallel beta-helix repeat protein